MTTTNVNPNSSTVKTVDVNTVKAALDRLKQRNEKQEIVLAEFPVMQGYSIIPREAIEDYLSSEGKKANSEVLAKFSGEIFSTDKLLELQRLRDAVTKRLSSYGSIVGKCCTYVTATADHNDIVNFLSEMKREYSDIVNDMLCNYDALVAAHVQKLQTNIPNAAARAALIAKIPTKEKIAERHVAQFRFFKGYCPEEDDLTKSAEEILAAVELAEKQDLAFVEKVSVLFKQFLDTPKNQDALGKRYSAFCKAVETGLSFERSTKLIMAGSQYENIAEAQFELLHQAHANLIAYSPTRTEKEKLARVLNDKFRQVAYVLSCSKELMAFAHGNLPVFDGTDFIKKALKDSNNLVIKQRLSVKTTFADKTAPVDDPDGSDNTATAATPVDVKVPEYTSSDSANIDFGTGHTIDAFDINAFLGEPTAKAAKTESSSQKAKPREMSKEEKLQNIEDVLAELMGNAPSAEVMKTNPDNAPMDNTEFVF